MASRRRRLPTRRLGAALAVLAGMLALAACGGGSDGSESGDGTSVAPAGVEFVTSTPAGTGPVDSISWNLPYGEPFTLDWLQSASYSENTVLANLCESVLRLGNDFSYEPGLAESFESPNPTTWVYDLRPGLKFSDGKPVTTADVIFSMERSADGSLGSFWEPWFENVKSITATGPNQITVKLTKPDALFNQFLATAAGVVAEKAFVEAAGKSYGTSEGGVMCVGPYKLDEWTPGKGITISANPEYWGDAPAVGKIDYKFVTNGGTATDALSSGEIDGSYEAPLGSWDNLVSSGAGNAYIGRSTAYSSIDFTEKEGPLEDVNLRQALRYVVDRDAIAETIFKGTAEAVRSQFYPSTWGYAEDVYKQGYEALPEATADLAKAEEFVAKVDDLRPLTLLSNADDTAAKQLAVYLQSEAQKVGIEIEIKELPAPQFIAAAFDRKRLAEYDISLSTTGYIDLAEPVVWGYLVLSADGVFNSAGYDNPQVTKWVGEARETEDPTKRAELMVKVQKQAYDVDVASIPLVNMGERLFMGSSISGAIPSLTPQLYSPWALELGAAE